MTKIKQQAFPSAIREIEGITEYRLENGLSVLLFPDSSAQNVTVNLTYLVGSRHEGRGEAGMAHLLEHMLFKGTPKHPNVKAALQDRGAFFNATTWYDRTNYYEVLAATDENLEFALKLEADRMINSWIRQEDLDAEMTVVRNEFEMGENNPLHVLYNQMFSTAYQWHNYGKTTIGNRSDIERVPVKNLRAFYQHYYQPDNAVLIVAGNFKEEQTQAWIMDYFGNLPKPTRSLDQTYTEEPTQDGARHLKLLRAGDVSQAGVVYHIPAASHPDFTALLVLSEVLGDEPSGLLYQALVQAGLASELYTVPYALKEPGLFTAFTRPAQLEQTEAVLAKMVELLESLNETQLTPENVERAKTRILKHIKQVTKNSKDLALALSESIAQGDYRLFFYLRDQVKVISADDVLRVASTYFVESNRTTGVFIPTEQPLRAPIPPTPEVECLLDGYAGSEEIHPGEEFEATPENIDAHTARTVLAGTIKTALLSKSTRGKANHARLIFRFGNEQSLNGKRAILQLLPSLLDRGTEKLTYQAVQDKLDKLHSSLHIGAAQPGVVYADIISDQDHLEEVLKLAGEQMQTPRFSQEEFTIVKAHTLDNLKEARTDPMQVGMHELTRLLLPFQSNSIHYVPTLDEKMAELKAVTLEDAQELYQALYGANHLEFVSVGDFDPTRASQTVESIFSHWKSPVPYSRIVSQHVPALAELRTIRTPDKQMAIVAMGANFAMRDDDAHYPALHMANYIFGESMKSRLMQRLREKEGLSYGAGSSLEIGRQDAVADISLYAMCATDKAEQALKALREEYERWLENGVTEQELTEGKQSFKLYFNNLLSHNSFVIRALGSMMEMNRTFAYYTQFLNQIAALQTHDIQNALTTYLQPAPVAIVKAGDLKG